MKKPELSPRIRAARLRERTIVRSWADASRRGNPNKRAFVFRQSERTGLSIYRIYNILAKHFPETLQAPRGMHTARAKEQASETLEIEI